MNDLGQSPRMAVDETKAKNLMRVWAEHEHWTQSGCPDPPDHDPGALGLEVIARQGPRPYALYQDWLALFVADIRGQGGVMVELEQLIRETDSVHPTLMKEMQKAYAVPDSQFKAQWNNLFATKYWTGLTHEAVDAYVRKYEVEAPLRFLAHVREISSQGALDLSLSRFRDRRGRLRKGVLIDYVHAGFGEYPNLTQAIREAYSPPLRNAVAHNSYVITGTVLEDLDGKLVLDEDAFLSHMRALEILQNAVLWVQRRAMENPQDSPRAGVIAVGWVPLNAASDPEILLFQLLPFWLLDRDATWLQRVSVKELNGELRTDYGGIRETIGPMTPQVRDVVARAQEARVIQAHLQPIIPCVHRDHPAWETENGTFCSAAEPVVRSLPFLMEELQGPV